MRLPPGAFPPPVAPAAPVAAPVAPAHAPSREALRQQVPRRASASPMNRKVSTSPIAPVPQLASQTGQAQQNVATMSPKKDPQKKISKPSKVTFMESSKDSVEKIGTSKEPPSVTSVKESGGYMTQPYPVIKLQVALLLEFILLLMAIPFLLYVINPMFSYRLTLGAFVALSLISIPIMFCIVAIFAIHSFKMIFDIRVGSTMRQHPRSGILAISVSRAILAVFLLIEGGLLFATLGSSSTQEVVHERFLHLIKNSAFDTEYLNEIHTIQQSIGCCGVRTEINDSTITENFPWNAWFKHRMLDESYPNEIRIFYSLPWSCCRFSSSTPCEHLGFSRYIQASDDDLSDLESDASKLLWNTVRLDEIEKRNQMAVDSVYYDDCSEKLAETLNTIGIKTGSVAVASGIVLLINTSMLAAIGWFSGRRPRPKSKKTEKSSKASTKSKSISSEAVPKAEQKSK